MFDDVVVDNCRLFSVRNVLPPSPHHSVLRELKGTSENSRRQHVHRVGWATTGAKREWWGLQQLYRVSGRCYNRCTEKVGPVFREWEGLKQVAMPDLQSFLYR